MILKNWTPVPLEHANRESRDYRKLLARIDHPDTDETADGGRKARALDQLDRLAPYLDRPLLQAETVAPGFELVHLATFPDRADDRLLLIGLDSAHVHLFRLEDLPEKGFQLQRWTLPVEGTPIGMTFQAVGHLAAVEAIIVCTAADNLLQYRIDVSSSGEITVLQTKGTAATAPVAIGANDSPLETSVQLEVRRTQDVADRPTYELLARPSPYHPWKTIHRAAHPLHHPLFDGETLYFVARSNEIVAVSDPFGPRPPVLRPIITLDTPVPAKALLSGPGTEKRALIAAMADGTVFSIDLDTGRPAWKYDTRNSLAAATFAGRERHQLVTATPGGLLTFYEFSDSRRVWNSIERLLSEAEDPPETLLRSNLPVEPPGSIRPKRSSSSHAAMPGASPPGRRFLARPESVQPGVQRPFRPYLCMLLIDRLLRRRDLPPEQLTLIRDGLIHLFSSAGWLDDTSAATVVRFLTWQFASVIGDTAPGTTEGRAGSDEPRLHMLFTAVAAIAPFTHGDARRRIERLLRRLRNQWLDPETFDRYRARNPQALSPWSHWPREDFVVIQEALEAANAAETWDEKVKNLYRAAVLTWQRHSYPLCRTTTLPGVTRVVRIVPGDTGCDTPSGGRPVPARMAAIHEDGLQVYLVHPSAEIPEPSAFEQIPGATALASLSHRNRPALLALTTHDRLLLYTATVTGDHTYLHPVESATLDLEEPVTALSLLEIPVSGDSDGHATVLALGQADGRLRLFAIREDGGAASHACFAGLDPTPLLELHRQGPVHHVAVASWRQKPTLLVDGARDLLVCTDLRLRAGSLSFQRSALRMTSPVTAFRIAGLETSGGGRPPRLLLVGLANGFILAFGEPARPTNDPELCWLYQCSRGITDLCHIRVAGEDRFVAALDDGSLLILKNGEVVANTMVERYPTDLAPLRFPTLPHCYLLVSSRAGTAAVLEMAEGEPLDAVRPILDQLAQRLPERGILELFERRGDPASLALSACVRGARSAGELVAFMERHGTRLLANRPATRALVRCLLEGLDEEPETRPRAYECLRHFLASGDGSNVARKYLVQALGLLLDRLGADEQALVLSTGSLDDQSVARAYLKALEHLWYRFRDEHVDALFWWRALHHLAEQSSGTLGHRQVLPVAGTFCRKLLEFSRANALASIRLVRDLEDQNIRIAEWVCEALSLPHVVDDPVARRAVSQYATLLQATTPTALENAIRERRDLLAELEDALPGATEERLALEDILETFGYRDYDQYSRFLVDAPEFLPSVRSNAVHHAAWLKAFAEVRTRLLAAVPPISSERDDTSRFQDRIQVLVAHSETLLGFKQRWKGGAALEQRVVAAVVNRWRQKILRPEIRRLQDAVHLEVRDVRVTVAEDGLAVVSARIHNLGGHPLEGLMVGLRQDERATYLWDGTLEWCQGPINYGQAIEYRTEILVDPRADHVTLSFELNTSVHEEKAAQCFTIPVKVIREESTSTVGPPTRWRQEAPVTFEAMLHRLRHASAGQAIMLAGEDIKDSDDLALELAQSLAEGVTAARRAVVILNLASMLEGPPRMATELTPSWWLTHRLARALYDQDLLSTFPDRGTLRSDPDNALTRILYQVSESVGALWLVFKKTSRAMLVRAGRQAAEVMRWIGALLDHPSHKVHLLLSVDRATAARLAIAPSPLAGRMLVIDTELPFPPGASRAEAEHLARAAKLFEVSRLTPSRHIVHKLVAHAGWNLTFVRLLAEALEDQRADNWLNWRADERSGQGEPEELDRFLVQKALPAVSRLLKERMRSLPPLHRLALAAVGSARTRVTRRELRPGMILADDVMTQVRARGNRSKRLYPAGAVLLPDDVKYLRITVGNVRGQLRTGMFRSHDFRCALAHVLAVTNIEAMLSDLVDLGILRRLSYQDGTAWSVAIPLFRRWLNVNHPFEPGEEGNIRHRLLEGELVAESIPLSVYPALHKRLRTMGQLRAFLVFLGLIQGPDAGTAGAVEDAEARWERLVALAKRVRAWNDRPGAETFRNVVRDWASLFSVEPSIARHEIVEGTHALTLDLSSLRIPRLSRATVFGVPAGMTFLEAQNLREVLRRSDMALRNDPGVPGSQSIGFILETGGEPPGGRTSASEPEERELLGERLIRLTERRLTRAALGRGGRHAFLDLLAGAGFQFKHLSPYQLVGPLIGRAMDVLFVGRESEIDEILRHPDKAFAIVGSRKIGKTTLLLKVRQVLSTELGSRARVVFLDCARLDPDAVWREIARVLRLPALEPSSGRLQLERHLQQSRQRVVLLLDEIDGIYDQPGEEAEKQAETLMWNLRSLANAGLVRLVMAGYAKIHELRLNPRSAFHNFTTFIRLGALSLEAARTLVRNPMGALDIELASDGLLDVIVERTYRVPWIIQLFCDQLIARLDERLARQRRLDRRIQREDVDGVAIQIEEQLYTHFTSPRVMSIGEQFVLLTLVAAGVNTFTEEDLHALLETEFGSDIWRLVPFEGLHRSLDNLTLTLALTVKDGVYSFPLDMYPSVIRNRLGDVRPRVQRLLEELSRS